MPVDDIELAIVLGGDGTILRAAELVRDGTAPVLGINMGHVGFLAEIERDDMDDAVRRVIARDYRVEERLALACGSRTAEGAVIYETWALNEATVEKASRERMLEVVIEVDGRPLSTFGCDGVVVSTPTGSTAYNFSAGGPVIWPTVEAIAVVPLSAHALFAKPLVVGPEAAVAIARTSLCDPRALHRSSLLRRRSTFAGAQPGNGLLHMPPRRAIGVKYIVQRTQRLARHTLQRRRHQLCNRTERYIPIEKCPNSGLIRRVQNSAPAVPPASIARYASFTDGKRS